MNRYIIIALSLMALTGYATAGEASKPETKAAPLTYEQALSVDQGLHALDGYQHIVKDGQQEMTVVEFYKLGPGVRVQIGLAIASLDAAAKTFAELQNKLIKQYSAGAGKVPDSAMSDYLAAISELRRTPSGVVVPHLTVKELNLDQNPIPGSVLGMLSPILDQKDAP
jgi:hypothetical protein